MLNRCAILMAACLALAGCATSPKGVLPTGAQAYDVIPAADLSKPEPLYRIGAGDKISVSVFQEPDLSVESAVIDEAGNVQLPLIGQVAAKGLTATELSDAIAGRLGARYLRNPKVVVGVSERFQQVVAVEGQVNEPGVYSIDRTYTLLSALARAKSPTKTAKLDEVVVFRTVNGQRMGAVFNLGDIRAGKAADPQILGGDVVVVGFSEVKGAFRDFLLAAPLFNLFTLF
jgi:polysaccharide export outer membrane protein